jgi:hypothetical protein
MTVANLKLADGSPDVAPLAQTGHKFAHYVSMLCEVLSEALQQTQEVRRKYPFADV